MYIQDTILNIQDKKYLQPCPLRGSVYIAVDLTEYREIYIPHLYLAPSRPRGRRKFAKMFSTLETRMIGLRHAEESHDDMLSRFDVIPERDRQTDRQTDRKCYINIARRHWCADGRQN